jgi:hypothetical protein
VQRSVLTIASVAVWYVLADGTGPQFGKTVDPALTGEDEEESSDDPDKNDQEVRCNPLLQLLKTPQLRRIPVVLRPRCRQCGCHQCPSWEGTTDARLP